MRSRFLSSAIFPAVALPALAFGPGGHAPVLPGFGIARAVHIVTSAVGSLTSPTVHAAPRRRPVHHTVHPRTRPASFVVIDCSGGGVVRPRVFHLACTDGNDRLSRLNWSVWDPDYATGVGLQTMNDCTPSCARGTYSSYPIRVILWGAAPVPGHSAKRRYTMITLLYTGRQPSVSSGATRMAGPLSVTGNLWN